MTWRVALGLLAGLTGVLTSPAAETPESVTPADVVAPTDTAARETLAKPPPKSGMVRFGGFELFPRASTSFHYDDNITIQAVNKLSDLIWELTPGVMVLTGNPGVDLGQSISFDSLRSLPRQPYIGLEAEPAKFLLVDVAPTFRVYAEHGQYNVIDLSGRLTGFWSFSRLTLGLDLDYVKSTTATADVGNLVTSQNLTARLTTKYDLSDRTCFQVNGQYVDFSYEDPRYTGSQLLVSENWINRQLSGKVNAAVGLTFGHMSVERSASQTYVQLLARGIYRFAEKMDITAFGGGEWRQYAGGAPATLNPVLGLSGVYRPLDSTTFTLDGHVLQQASASAGSQNYELAGLSASVRRRVAEKWFASLSGGYDNITYHATALGITASRKDSYLYVRPSVDFQFAQRWTGSLYYRYGQDVSNVPGGRYADNQIGVQASWSF